MPDRRGVGPDGERLKAWYGRASFFSPLRQRRATCTVAREFGGLGGWLEQTTHCHTPRRHLARRAHITHDTGRTTHTHIGDTHTAQCTMHNISTHYTQHATHSTTHTTQHVQHVTHNTQRTTQFVAILSPPAVGGSQSAADRCRLAPAPHPHHGSWRRCRLCWPLAASSTTSLLHHVETGRGLSCSRANGSLVACPLLRVCHRQTLWPC